MTDAGPLVMLNLFQHPSFFIHRSALDVPWTLKQVQGDKNYPDRAK